MVQTIMPNQDLPIVSPQKILSRPQLGHILTCEIVYYHILSSSSKLVGTLDGLLV